MLMKRSIQAETGLRGFTDLIIIQKAKGTIISIIIVIKSNVTKGMRQFGQDLCGIFCKQMGCVSNLRTAWMGGFHLFADVAKYGRTYNRPVERSGEAKNQCRYGGGDVGFGWNFDSDQRGKESRTFKGVKKIYFLEFKMFLTILCQMNDVFGLDPGGFRHWQMGFQRFDKKLGGRWGSSRVYGYEGLSGLREEDVRGVKSNLVDYLKKAEVSDEWCLVERMVYWIAGKMNLEDDAGEIVEFILRVIVGYCYHLMINEDVTQVIALE
ncbi:hypothetical protein Tco_0099900 [Tanacetum coccineum]